MAQISLLMTGIEINSWFENPKQPPCANRSQKKPLYIQHELNQKMQFFGLFRLDDFTVCVKKNRAVKLIH